MLELKTTIYEFKKKHPQVTIIFKTTNYFPGDFTQQKATVSAYNAKRLDKIASTVFDDDEKVRMVNLYDRTELIYDQFARSMKGIHPGSDGSTKWVLNEVLQAIFDFMQ